MKNLIYSWNKEKRWICMMDIYDHDWYRLIIFRIRTYYPFCLHFYRNNWQMFLHRQYCHVKFSLKFFDKSVNKRNFLKIANENQLLWVSTYLLTLEIQESWMLSFWSMHLSNVNVFSRKLPKLEFWVTESDALDQGLLCISYWTVQ